MSERVSPSSEQVLFAIACTLEVKDLIRFASVSSSLRSLSFNRKVWQRHFAHGELDETTRDYVQLYKRCQESKEATERFLHKFWTVGSVCNKVDFTDIPNHRILGMLNCFTQEELLEIHRRGREKPKTIFFVFVADGEKRLCCTIQDTERREIHMEHLDGERSWLLFYKLRLYDVLRPAFYEQISILHEKQRQENIIKSITKSSYCDESWYGSDDEYTCDRCGKYIPEGEEEMSYTSKNILCPACLKYKLTKWAARFVKDFVQSDKEYIFVNRSDRERAFLYQELEKQTTIKFAKFNCWEEVVVCTEHECRPRSIGDKYVCVRGKLDDERSLCTETLVRSKIRKTVLYKGEGRDRMAWRKLYQDQC
jgi:hypothetical protein